METNGKSCKRKVHGESFKTQTAKKPKQKNDKQNTLYKFREILGKGAMKKVYKAFDEVLGMEVAWNQVKLADVFRSPDELQRLYSEIHLLNYLDHSSIMQFYESWIDIHRKTFNFVNRDVHLQHPSRGRQRVDIRVRCLAYPHCHDPPVIHRDLKCDNIFVHGHLGQVKIGDL
ncbi:probable serine/threonine-protein kinase WNK5 [Gossypium arboreum]|uniref:probable serine/threonine-protein kinase WNK5 n=1 Tax=Gossypium arboreum TaxID=29729 RepID=UPI0022F19078|nr:probable serine/threonine-protein kinase WNK5 [Gossypium arboreum]